MSLSGGRATRSLDGADPSKSGFDDRRTIKTIRATRPATTTINLLTPATASETAIGAFFRGDFRA